jgi:hypothetical protein
MSAWWHEKQDEGANLHVEKKTFTEQEKECMHERGVVQHMMNNKRQECMVNGFF